MALSEKQKQKKLAKKKQKRNANAKIATLHPNQARMAKPRAYAKYPLHQCLMSKELFKSGIGNIVVSRRTPSGDIAFSAFIVDVFCLGVKDAFFNVIPEYNFDHTLKVKLFQSPSGGFEIIHPTCARKLVEGAVQYAQDFGFSSHTDYKNANQIFGDIEAGACPVKYQFGQNGKPFYISGPYESDQQVNKVLAKLKNKCGEGGFEYLLTMLR